MKLLAPISAAAKSQFSAQNARCWTPRAISVLTMKKVFKVLWFQTHMRGLGPCWPVSAYSEKRQRHIIAEVCSWYSFYSFVIESRTIPRGR